MIRGGSWNNNGVNCTAANRNTNAPDNANNNVGFRLLAALREMRMQNPTEPAAFLSLPRKGKSDNRAAQCW